MEPACGSCSYIGHRVLLENGEIWVYVYCSCDQACVPQHKVPEIRPDPSPMPEALTSW